MRILLVSSATQTSKTGVTAHYNRLLAQMADRVESIQVITPADTPFLAKKILGAFRRVASLLGQDGKVLYMELDNFISIWISVRRKGAQSIDLVHAQDTTSGAAAALGLARKVRVIVTCHFNDDPLTEYREKYKLSSLTTGILTKWYKFLFRQSDAYITVSDYTKNAAAFLRPTKAACTVIHNGVEFPQKLIRQGGGPFIIINIGTIEERKNQRLLIDTAEILRNRGFTHFQVWLLGEGPKRAEWEALVKEKNLEGYVSFLGYRSNVPEFLQRASLYVHTALNEAWGYSITEAIAAGTPVLALATGGIPEQFDRQNPGLLPKETTASEMADAILRYQLPESRIRLANRQMHYARDRFRLDIMINKHLAFYQDVIERQERSTPKKLLVGDKILSAPAFTTSKP